MEARIRPYVVYKTEVYILLDPSTHTPHTSHSKAAAVAAAVYSALSASWNLKLDTCAGKIAQHTTVS